MKQGEVSNWWAHADGVKLRIWIRGENGRVLTVGDVWLTLGEVSEMAMCVTAEQQRDSEWMLSFDG